jgi:predicted nucleic acid-binding protein
MRYWDSSALLPLLVQQTASARTKELLDADSAVVTWWGSAVECASAIARLEREALMTPEGASLASANLRSAATHWIDIPATAMVREQAMRLVRLHSLRAADSLQLAAAIVAADFQPSTVGFVTLDKRLALAAEREGFTVVT